MHTYVGEYVIIEHILLLFFRQRPAPLSCDGPSGIVWREQTIVWWEQTIVWWQQTSVWRQQTSVWRQQTMGRSKQNRPIPFSINRETKQVRPKAKRPFDDESQTGEK
ncbi:MAG: hypothetical protein HXK18_02130 [Alloprevotella tannerae]|nr:hypothetical protein [Alloprevotella tannerae]